MKTSVRLLAASALVVASLGVLQNSTTQAASAAGTAPAEEVTFWTGDGTRGIYAHQGGPKAYPYPGNSMPAYRLSMRDGFPVETDLRLTKDLRVAIHHDDLIPTSCEGPGAGRLISEITGTDVRLTSCGGHRLLLIDNLISLSKQYPHSRLMLETKEPIHKICTGTENQSLVNVTARKVMSVEGLGDRVMMMSFCPAHLTYAKKILPDSSRMLLLRYNKNGYGWIDNGIRIAKANGATTVAANRGMLGSPTGVKVKELVKRTAAADIDAVLWGIRPKEGSAYRQAGISGLITDWPTTADPVALRKKRR